MPVRVYFWFPLLLLIVFASPVEAQAEYFVRGEPVGAMGGYLLRQGPISGRSLQAGVMVSPRMAISIGVGRSSIDEEFYTSTWNVGVTIYAGRQDMDGPLTVAATFDIGRLTVEVQDYDGGRDVVGRATPLLAGAALGRDVTPPGSPIAVVPSAQAALLILMGDAPTTSVTLGAGLGLGLRLSPAVVFAFEPGLSYDLGPGDSEVALVGGVSLAIAY